jgi:hypothetical protein
MWLGQRRVLDAASAHLAFGFIPFGFPANALAEQLVEPWASPLK